MHLSRLVALLALVPIALVGCGDECNPDTEPARCEGNVAVWCSPPGVDQLVGGARLSREDCGANTCVAPEGRGVFCALSGEPAAACAGDLSSACEDAKTKLYCSDGYARSRFACISCVQEGNVATCNGGLSARCQSARDCLPELVCSELGYCSRPK